MMTMVYPGQLVSGPAGEWERPLTIIRKNHRYAYVSQRRPNKILRVATRVRGPSAHLHLTIGSDISKESGNDQSRHLAIISSTDMTTSDWKAARRLTLARAPLRPKKVSASCSSEGSKMARINRNAEGVCDVQLDWQNSMELKSEQEAYRGGSKDPTDGSKDIVGVLIREKRDDQVGNSQT